MDRASRCVWTMFVPRCAAAVLLAALSSCSPPPGDSGDGQDDGVRINGSERIGWSQVAASQAAAARYEYVVYVDGRRTGLGRASCESSASATYSCSAPLPALAPGRRVLELAAVSTAGGAPREGPRSEPLVVYVDPAALSTWGLTAGSQPGASAGPAAEPVCFDSGSCYQPEVWAIALEQPNAIAALPDGRLLVADEAVGVVAVSTAGSLASVDVSSPCSRSGRVSSLAVHPAFEGNGIVYVGWTCQRTIRESVLLVVRYRELGGVLGEAATILEWPLNGGLRPRMAVGGDETLYIAVAQNAFWAILRVNPDGTVPRSNPTGSPVIGHVREAPAFSAAARGVWVLDRGSALLVLEEQAEGAETDLSSQRVEVPWPGVKFDALAATPARPWLLLAESDRTDIRRLLRTGPGSVQASGAIQVPVCGRLTELAWGPGETFWGVGFVDPAVDSSVLASEWRICRFDPLRQAPPR